MYISPTFTQWLLMQTNFNITLSKTRELDKMYTIL